MDSGNTAPSGPLPAEPDLDLSSLGVYSKEEASVDGFARVLVVGPAKAGKTTAIASTAPDPLVINCDGPSAVTGAAHHSKQQFLTVDVHNRPTWQKALAAAEKLVKAGRVRTIVIDTYTLLNMYLLDDIKKTLDGYDRWNELEDQIMNGYRRLEKLPCHLFVTAHMVGSHEDASGILPMGKGSTKQLLPASVVDWILLDVEAGRKPHERMWVLGPQKEWNHSGRNIKRTCMVEATVPALLKELGISL